MPELGQSGGNGGSVDALPDQGQSAGEVETLPELGQSGGNGGSAVPVPQPGEQSAGNEAEGAEGSSNED